MDPSSRETEHSEMKAELLSYYFLKPIHINDQPTMCFIPFQDFCGGGGRGGQHTTLSSTHGYS